MGAMTGIQWCDSTVNPVSGCDGCELWQSGKGGPCYAGNLQTWRLSKSLPHLYSSNFSEVRTIAGRMAEAAKWGDLRGKGRPGKPWLDGRPRMIFVGDLGDVLSKGVPFEFLRDEVIDTARFTPGSRHVWLVLTKRPARLAEFAGWLLLQGIHWPDNVWAGTSVTDQKTARTRIPALQEVPAAVRFVSAEPLRGPVDLLDLGDDVAAFNVWERKEISWVVVGGESRQNRYEPTPFHLAWARTLRDQCRNSATPFFFKQQGARPVGSAGVEIDFGSSHGDEWDTIPPDLQIREVPR